MGVRETKLNIYADMIFHCKIPIVIAVRPTFLVIDAIDHGWSKYTLMIVVQTGDE